MVTHGPAALSPGTLSLDHAREEGERQGLRSNAGVPSGRSVTSKEAGPRVTLLGFTDPYHRGQRSPGRLSVSHHLLVPLGRQPPAGGQVARHLPGRHSLVAASRCAAGLDFLWCVVPPWCPQGPQAQAGHYGRLVGTATPLRGHRRPGPVRASAHLSRVLVGAGVAPAVHSHGPAPSAPVVTALIARLRTVG